MAHEMERHEAELIAGLQRHEARAMAELYDRYGRLVYSVILRVVRDQGIAEDLTQETFLRVWNRVQGFDGGRGALGTWLVTIARNRSIDYVRSVRLRNSRTEEFDEVNSTLSTDAAEEATAFERRHTLRAAMKKLLPNHMRAIELAYFEGLSHLEVAERLGQPLGTVKSWVRTALAALREDLTASGAAC